MEKEIKSSAIAGLDLIRFAAAVMVAMFHLAYFEWILTDTIFLRALAPFFSFGWVGVEIFFVLSGFVIAYSANGKSALTFARSRFLRLYPGAWVCASITGLVLVGGGDNILGPFLRSIFLWPFGPWVDGVYWTLGIEMAFYGLVFLLLASFGFGALFHLMASIGLISSAFWFSWFFDHVGGADSFGWTMGHRYFELLLIHYGCFFALGGSIWLILLNKSSWIYGLLAGVSAVSGLICIYAIAQAKASAGQGHAPIVPMLAWVVSVLGIILSVSMRDRMEVLSGPIIRILGQATYPLYLLHHTLGTELILLLRKFGIDAVWCLVTAMLAVITLSILALYPEKVTRRLSAIVWDTMISVRIVGKTRVS